MARALTTLEAAEARFQWRDLEGAEQLASEAVCDLPAHPRAHYLLGLVLLARDRASDAAGAFTRALDLDPGFADAAAKLHIAQERVQSRASAPHSPDLP
jgi:cytochrome c-type biogenesis protein CcmH/NrfG